MRIVLHFILIFNLQLVQACDFDYNGLRKLYMKASNNEVECKKLYKLTEETILEENILAYSYHAISKMLISKFALNPLIKYSEFNAGKEMLEKAISSDSNNLELRFLRYSVQINASKFLNYNEDLESDSLFITSQLESNVELKSFIKPIFNTL